MKARSYPGRPVALARRLCVLSVLLLVCAALSSAVLSREAQAQSLVPDSQAGPLFSLNTHGEALPALQRTVSLDLGEASLARLLQEIARQGDFGLSYSPDLIAEEQIITVRIERGSVADALRAIVAHTDLKVLISPRKEIVLVRKSSPEAAASVPIAGLAAYARLTPEQLPVQGLVPVQVRRQTGTITGVVTDAQTGETLPGVNVIASDLTEVLGAATDAEGRYTIEAVPAGEHTVEAQFVGFQTATKQVTVVDGQTVTVDFALREATLGLDEVIVTGMAGNARRREIGVTVAQIGASEIEAAPVADFGDLLQGRVAGVTIMDNSGQVGAGSTIRLRGINSITQGNTPLIYVDGVRVSNSNFGAGASNQTTSPLNAINPNNIQRIEIIKGPAATTLYGTEAASGVIQIFTKRGTEGVPQFNFSVRQGINRLAQAGTQDYHAELSLNDCSGETGCPEDGDWLRTGHTQSYNLSARGGTGDLGYFISGNWGSAEGIIAPQATSSYNLRVNLSTTPVENLQIRFTNNYSFRNTRWIPDGNYFGGFLLNVLRGDQGYTPNNNDALILESELRTESNHFISGLSFDWTPTSSMLHQLTLGLDYVLSEYTSEQPFGFWSEPLGSRGNDTRRQRKLTLDYTGSLNMDIVPSISSTTSWGGQLYSDQYVALSGSGEEFAGPGRKVVSNAARTSASESRTTVVSGGFFVQERFGWNDQLFLTLGLRVDGHSTFGEDFGLAPYPKVSGSYVISDHSFWPEWWETLKLRAAYGEAGKAPGVFDALRTYASVAGDEGEPGVTPANLGNPNLGPERSREIEAGFETSLFNGRVSAIFTWYRQHTYDALIPVQPVPSEGFIQSQLRNIGVLENKGVEASLDVAVLRRQNLRWSVGGYFSTSYNEAVDLGGIQSILVGDRNQYVRPGYPVPSGFGLVVTNPDEVGAEPEFEEQYLGSPYPTETFGLNMSLTLWQRLTIDVLGAGQFGHTLFTGLAYQSVRRSIWPTCTEIQAQIEAGNTSGLTAGQIAQCGVTRTTEGMWTKPADFFKVRSISASYRLPDGWLPSTVRNVTLRLQAKNLFTFTDWPGLDPEAFEDGDVLYRHSYYNIPPARSFSFVLNVGF